MLWKRLFSRKTRDQDLADEIEAHLRMDVQDRMERGETAGQAALRARNDFGNALLIREVTRDVWGWNCLEVCAQDLKFALRQLLRSPRFAAIAVATLALGLAAVTTVFSVVNGVLLQPLAYRQPGRLYLAETAPPANSGIDRLLPVNARHFHEWREHCQSCESVALFQGIDLTLTGAGEPVRLPGLEVSFNFFRTLGLHPALGRDFLKEEENAPNCGELILTDGLWRSRFAADPSIVGRSVRVNGEQYLVVGIMPRNLHLPRGKEWGAFVGPQAQPLAFVPLRSDGSRDVPAGNLNYSSVLRLKAGVGAGQAAAELNGLLAGFVRQYQLETRVVLTPLKRQVIRLERDPLLLLLGAVAAVLLIVCANIGNLMLVRSAGRYREAGVRLALGAGRLRIFRMVLMEAFLLVLAGSAAGLVAARGALRLFVARAPSAIPRLDEVRIDWRVLVFSCCALAACTILCGLVPAWRLSGIQPLESLKAGGGTATEGGQKVRFREFIIALEVALSTILLIAGGLLMMSFFRLVAADRGFEIAHVVTQDVSFLNPKYARGVRRGFVGELLARLSVIPGVQSAGAVSQLPLLGEEWVSGLEDPDRPARAGHGEATANFRFVTPGYFKAMGIPLRQGRFLDESDLVRPAAVISAAAAHFLWGGQNPIGRHVRGAGSSRLSLEVVGVVGEVRGNIESAPPMMVYEHFWRMQPVAMSFVLRTTGSPGSVAADIHSVLSAADPEMAIAPARTMEQILVESVAPRKFSMFLAVAFAIAALALAGLGIYGVVSFSVARRTPEIGIRIALGATGGQLTRMMIRQGMLPVAGGLAAGLAGSFLAGRLIANQLFGITPNDPVPIAIVAFLILAVGFFACWLPARRATAVDPQTALRFD